MEAAAGFIDAAATAIRYRGAEVTALIAEGAAAWGDRLPFLIGCRDRCGQGVPFPTAWREALAEAPGRLTAEEQETLAAFGRGLGTSDREGQLAHCRACGADWRRRLEEVRAAEPTRKRLWRSLSALAAAAVVILFV